jgi:DNA invertase Pin-like site-specific DNA recombinase
VHERGLEQVQGEHRRLGMLLLQFVLPADAAAAAEHPGLQVHTLGQELDSQLAALAAKNIPRDKIFAEKISTRGRVRPMFGAALAAAREIKAHAPHCRVIFKVYEMKRLGRDAAELTALADHLAAHGLVLEMLAGPLAGIYDPTGHGRLLFAFFAAMAETERENIRESTLEGLDAAARKGKHGGRPPVITDDMLHTVLRRRANGETVEQIQPDLIIPTGERKGQNPSLSSIYRALRRTWEATGISGGRRAGARRLRRRPEGCEHPGPDGGKHQHRREPQPKA